MNISKEEREKIKTQLQKDVGERYDYATALGLSVRVAASKMFELVKKEKKEVLDDPKRYICSDLIAYTYMELSPAFKNVIKRNFKRCLMKLRKIFVLGGLLNLICFINPSIKL